MDRSEALSLAALVAKAAPWAESIYAFPVRPAEQRFPEGPYTIFLSSAYLYVEVTSLQEWLELLMQLQPSLGPTRLPLLDEHQFNEWATEQLARTDLDEREQRCSTKDLSLFAHHSWLNILSQEVSFQETIAPVVDGGRLTQNRRVPTKPEIILTTKWDCPLCGCSLFLSKRLPAKVEDRISVPGPLHLASGTEKICSANVWVIIEPDEEENQEEGDPFYVCIWQVVHQQPRISESQKQEAESHGDGEEEDTHANQHPDI